MRLIAPFARDRYRCTLMARVKADTWTVFHVIIPCNCRYMALPNKEQKNSTQLPRDMKNQFQVIIISYAYCVRRLTPIGLRDLLTSAFCNLSSVRALRFFFLCARVTSWSRKITPRPRAFLTMEYSWKFMWERHMGKITIIPHSHWILWANDRPCRNFRINATLLS